MKLYRRLLFLLIAGFSLATAPASAQRLLPNEDGVPEPFRGHQSGSEITVSYADWDYILGAIVFEAGTSDRTAAIAPKHSVGTRVQNGNQSSRRLEGNRVMFTALDEDALAVVSRIRRELEAVPAYAPLGLWSRNEQLAYWLNLYNVTVIEQIGLRYPVRSLKSLYYGDREEPSLWDEKLLNVAGVPLSLNDIEHTILLQKWRNPLVIYGLFHGFVGSGNVRDQAYTAANVYELLEENAREFINSNRGLRIRGNKLLVAAIYEDFADYFPDFDEDIKAHLAYYSDFADRARIMAAKRVSPKTKDFYIADLNGGVKYTSDSALGNASALMGAVVGGGTFGGVDVPALSMDFGTELAQQSNTAASGLSTSRFPPQAMEYLAKVRKRNIDRDGTVDIEEIDPGKKLEPVQPVKDRVQGTDENDSSGDTNEDPTA
ncbi:MAG: DUF547 domain-containing protein [Alphaproteobacteria bacterium]|nr:MAG: DUF547 domain-containing protein [Alphaproteobacteria bacterium]